MPSATSGTRGHDDLRARRDRRSWPGLVYARGSTGGSRLRPRAHGLARDRRWARSRSWPRSAPYRRLLRAGRPLRLVRATSGAAFKNEPPTSEASSHLLQLGSYRYDFWRVALHEFTRPPARRDRLARLRACVPRRASPQPGDAGAGALGRARRAQRARHRRAPAARGRARRLLADPHRLGACARATLRRRRRSRRPRTGSRTPRWTGSGRCRRSACRFFLLLGSRGAGRARRGSVRPGAARRRRSQSLAGVLAVRAALALGALSTDARRLRRRWAQGASTRCRSDPYRVEARTAADAARRRSAPLAGRRPQAAARRRGCATSSALALRARGRRPRRGASCSPRSGAQPALWGDPRSPRRSSACRSVRYAPAQRGQEGPRHRRSGLHRLAPLRAAARRRLGGVRPRRRLHRVARQHRAPARPARLPPRRRLGALARGRERGRAQVRRRLPPGRGRRRPPDRRAARPHDGHERAGHRDRARLLQQVRQARAGRIELRGLRRPPRGAAAGGDRPPRLRADHREALAVRRLEGDGRAPRALVPPRARPRHRDRAALQHRRPEAERPLRDGDPALRRARARRRAARGARRRDARPAPSATSRTPSARSRA